MPAPNKPREAGTTFCQAITKAGSVCNRDRYKTANGETLDFCFYHVPPGSNPEIDEKRSHAGRKGGKITKYHTDVLPPISGIKTPAEVSAVLATALERLSAGKMNPRDCQAAASLASCLLKSIEAEAFAERIADLEAHLGLSNGETRATSAPVSDDAEWITQGAAVCR